MLCGLVREARTMCHSGACLVMLRAASKPSPLVPPVIRTVPAALGIVRQENKRAKAQVEAQKSVRNARDVCSNRSRIWLVLAVTWF